MVKGVIKEYGVSQYIYQDFCIGNDFLLKKCTKGGTLVVTVEIQVVVDKPPIWKPLDSFMRNLRQMYKTKKDADVNFVLGENCFELTDSS